MKFILAFLTFRLLPIASAASCTLGVALSWYDFNHPPPNSGGDDDKLHDPKATDQIANYVSGIDEVLMVNENLDAPLSLSDGMAIRQTTEGLVKASSTLSDQPIALLGYLTDFPGWM
jgi:hypothetical protein